MSKLVISGYGKSSRAKINLAIMYIITAIISFILAYTMGIDSISNSSTLSYLSSYGINLGYLKPTRPAINGLFLWFAASGVMFIILGILTYMAISKSQIEVYEDRVEGIGISKWFYFGDVRTFNFLLNIYEVSVDVNGEQLVVHGSDSEYKVYVENGREIQSAIFQLKKQIESKN